MWGLALLHMAFLQRALGWSPGSHHQIRRYINNLLLRDSQNPEANQSTTMILMVF